MRTSIQLTTATANDEKLRGIARLAAKNAIDSGVSPIGFVREFTGRDRLIVEQAVVETMREMNSRALQNLRRIVDAAIEDRIWGRP
jgi:hypothetical protein